MTVAYFNGRFMPLAEVTVSPLDRGFLFGDGVYEVIPCYAGKLFALEQHLRRLERSLEGVRINNPFSGSQCKEMLMELCSRNGSGEQLLYLQITRGVAPRDHKFPDVTPTVFAMTKTWERPITPAPISVITAEDNRWERCDIKATTLLANVLQRQLAIEAGAQECLLVRNQQVVEGAASNVFVVNQATIVTPPRNSTMLAGITREVVVDLLRDEGLDIREEPIALDVLKQADEVWVTSSSMEVRPVVCVDGRNIAGGKPGKIWSHLFSRFRLAALPSS